MRRLCFVVTALAIAGIAVGAQSGPNRVLKTLKVGGNGGFDYVYADAQARRLYIARRADVPSGQPARIEVFDLDTLASVGKVADVSAHGAVVDPKSGHGFASSKPVTMFDAKTLAVTKTIPVDGAPDGMLFDPFTQRLHVLSHAAPTDTVINTVDGTVVGTIDLGGAPEQAQTDGKGTIYVDLEDKAAVAVVDAKTLKVTATYDISATCGTPAGLGLDVEHHILFVACRQGGTEKVAPAAMTILDATTGKKLAALPIGLGTDGAGFNPNTMEAFSSNGAAGTLSIIKETNPTTFVVEQELQTVEGGNFKTMTIDAKTNRVLLIGAEYQAAPAPAAGAAAGGRGGARTTVPDSFTILVVGK